MSETTLHQFQMTFIVPEKVVPVFDGAFEEVSLAVMDSLIEQGAHKNDWRIDVIFNEKPDEAMLQRVLMSAAEEAKIAAPDYELHELPQKNWLKENLMKFPPLDFGRYFIYGSHIEYPQIPEGKIPLLIDAATAFGSGEHATTQGCLMAFEDAIKMRPISSILDMGCGSGILSMAAAKVLGEGVAIDAVDIDPESVIVTKKNIQINNVSQNINVFQSTGYEKVTGTYDLIFANILARPLMDMAEDLYQHLNKGGLAILSGFLNHQKAWVLKAHTKAGLSTLKDYKVREWSTAIVKRD